MARRIDMSRVRQAQSQLRSAVSRLQAAHRQLQHEVSHPTITIDCTCGHRSTSRRNVDSLPTECPSCGAPIVYR